MDRRVVGGGQDVAAERCGCDPDEHRSGRHGDPGHDPSDISPLRGATLTEAMAGQRSNGDHDQDRDHRGRCEGQPEEAEEKSDDPDATHREARCGRQALRP